MKMFFFIIFMIVGFIFSFFYEGNHESKVPAVFIFMIIAAIVGVILFPQEPEYDTYCERCDIDLMYDDAVADNRDDYFCYPCALEDLRYCYICKEYYDSFDYSSNSGCCENCTYEYFEPCYFCGGYDCDENNAVIVNIDGKSHYACPECMTEYFRCVDTKPLITSYYCEECFKVFSGNYYLRSYYYDADLNGTELICEDCAIATNFEDLKK